MTSPMEVSISGEDFLINGTVTYQGRTAVTLETGGTVSVEGLLFNSRMINACFDDDNAATRDNWAYPSGPAEPWDPDRNTEEFCAAVPSYAAKGIKLVSIGMQGGLPVGLSHPEAGDPPQWIVSAFNSNGTLKSAWMTRLATAINACRNSGICVKLQCFYFSEDSLLTNEAAVQAAVDNASDWVVAQGYEHVLMGTHNELGHVSWNTHAINENNRAHELIDRIKTRNPSLLVGVHMNSGTLPTAAIVTACDWIGFSSNNMNVATTETYIDNLRAMPSWSAAPIPILCLEDGPQPNAADFDACVRKGVSHGYYDLGPAGDSSNYSDGFQMVPANWTLNTTAKQTYFNRCQSYAGL